MRPLARIGTVFLMTALTLPGSALAAGATGDPVLSAAPPAADLTQPYVPGVVLVGFRPGATDAERAAARTSVGARSRPLSPLATDAEQWTLPAAATVGGAIAALQRNPLIAYAEPDYLLTVEATSNDPYFTNGSLWGMYGPATGTGTSNEFGSNAAAAWAAGYTGAKGVAIGVIDEGFQYTHPELAANTWTNPADPANGIDDDKNGYIDDIHGWDFNSNDNTTYDGSADDHGTHVSGTIGGQGGNGTGVAGVNWDVTLISGKFLGNQGGSTSNAVRAVDYMTDLKIRHGIRIVATSNSWGGGGFSSSLLGAIRRGGDAGILFIAAAGNSSSNNDATASYPSNYDCSKTAAGANRGWDCVIAVAATTSSGGLSSFSSYGASTVDIGAPGSGVVSSVPTDSYSSYSGTSMATPHVSGAAALCASIGTSLTAGEIRSRIISTATPTNSLSGRTASGGRLNVAKMAQACGAAISDTQAAGGGTGASSGSGGATSTPSDFSKTSPSDGAGGLSKQATLTWAASSNATGYDVCLTTASSCTSWSRFSSSTTAVRANVRSATVYTWQVRAVSSTGTFVYANGGTLWRFTTK